MIEHYAVVRLDRNYLRRLARIRRVARKDVEDGYAAFIECSDPASCPGWIECDEDHSGFDPDDENSPAYDMYDDPVMIHGVEHEWRHGHGWTVEYEGCPVERGCADLDTDAMDMTRPGRYLLDEDWDDTDCYLTVVREVTK